MNTEGHASQQPRPAGHDGTPQHGAVRLVDIARHANVSMKTVSRVLNDEPYVTARMREKVEAAARELGYIGDARARALRLNKSGFIGLLIPDIRNGYYALLIRAFEERLRAQGLTVLLGDSDERVEQEEEYLRVFRQQRVEGIFVVPVGAPSLAAAAEEIPTVMVDRTVTAARGRAGEVLANDRQAAETLVRHMVEGHGVRQVALLAGRTSTSGIRQRQAGYTRVMRQAGLPTVVSSGHVTPEEAASGALAMFQNLRPPFGVLCTGNRMFWGAMAAIAQLGLRIPADVVVTTFDSIGEATVTGLVPTFAVTESGEVADRALELFAERQATPGTAARRVVVDHLIEYGSTCGCHQQRPAITISVESQAAPV
ncbi:LacI family DNA-binding transcriptional regulator [Phytohabitans kaempferiae]|uniref:LacI family DNA-binding transcriptional regulator n=1 Tax=Phytohabitans kaempferiae TaxID=1620943 RepID=A0ABV6LZM5_9ACTN